MKQHIVKERNRKGKKKKGGKGKRKNKHQTNRNGGHNLGVNSTEDKKNISERNRDSLSFFREEKIFFEKIGPPPPLF